MNQSNGLMIISDRVRRGIVEPTNITASIVFICFFLISSLSYAAHSIALISCASFIALVGLVNAQLVWALLIVIAPFHQFFAFDAYDTRFLISIGLLVCLLRSAPLVSAALRHLGSGISGCSWLLVMFIVVVLLHFNTSDLFREAQAAALLITSFALYMAARNIPNEHRPLWKLMEFSFLVGALSSAMLSALFLYVPLPQLILSHLPVDNLRLTGVHDGVNATAKYLIPAAGCCLSQVLLGTQRRRNIWWGLLIFVAILLAATESKASIIALLLMCSLAILLVPVYLRTDATIAFLAVLSSLIAWIVFVQPAIEHRAAQAWSDAGNRNIDYYLATPARERTFTEYIKKQLRAGESTRMQLSSRGEIRYEKRSGNLWQTGQRDLVWRAGWDALKSNLWWGIGFDAWREEMRRRLGFPFVSPHNGFLETAGAFGIVGGVLYFLLWVFFFKSLLLLKHYLKQYPVTPACLWPALSIFSLLAIELVDVSTFLAPVLFTVWSWTLLGLHTGVVSIAVHRDEVGKNR